MLVTCKYFITTKWLRWKSDLQLLTVRLFIVVILAVGFFLHSIFGQQYGFIDKSGNFIISLSVDCDNDNISPASFSEGLCLDAKEKESTIYSPFPFEARCVYIDQTGHEVIRIAHVYGARSYSEGFAPVMLKNKRKFLDKEQLYLNRTETRERQEFLAAETSWSYLNKKGQTMPWGPFWQVQKFSEGLAAVRQVKSRKWNFIDRKGNKAFDSEFDNVGLFSEGIAAVCTDGKWGLIDNKGKRILSTSSYDRIGEFHEGLAAATRKKEGWLDYLNRDGEVQFSVKKTFAPNRRIMEADSSFDPDEFADELVSEGLIIFEKGGKCGYLNKSGAVAIAPQFARCGPFVEGRALYQLQDGGKYGFIAHNGKSVTGCKYSKAHNYSEGLAVVVYDGNEDFSHYIDKAGHDAFNRAYPDAKPFHDGRALAGKRSVIEFPLL